MMSSWLHRLPQRVRLPWVLLKIRTPSLCIRCHHRGHLNHLRGYQHHDAAVNQCKHRESGREATTIDHRKDLPHESGLRATMTCNRLARGHEAEMMYSRLERDPGVEMIRNHGNDPGAETMINREPENGHEAETTLHLFLERGLGVVTILNRMENQNGMI